MNEEHIAGWFEENRALVEAALQRLPEGQRDGFVQLLHTTPAAREALVLRWEQLTIAERRAALRQAAELWMQHIADPSLTPAQRAEAETTLQAIHVQQHQLNGWYQAIASQADPGLLQWLGDALGANAALANVRQRFANVLQALGDAQRAGYEAWRAEVVRNADGLRSFALETYRMGETAVGAHIDALTERLLRLAHGAVDVGQRAAFWPAVLALSALVAVVGLALSPAGPVLASAGTQAVSAAGGAGAMALRVLV